MKSQDNYKKKSKYKLVTLGLIFIGFFILSFNFLKINKFNYSGDLNFLDERVLKIISLTYLKDSPIFWFDKSKFEEELKTQLPQVKSISYSIDNSSTLGISIKAEDICCVIKDASEKKFVLSSEGVIVREFEMKENQNFEVISTTPKKIDDYIAKNLVSILKEFVNDRLKIDNVESKKIYLEDSYLYLITNDSKKILINERTDLIKLNDNYKSIKSHLEQNNKNYSILDFRFEKIIVK
jgi:cell division septal protein FtsQ